MLKRCLLMLISPNYQQKQWSQKIADWTVMRKFLYFSFSNLFLSSDYVQLWNLVPLSGIPALKYLSEFKFDEMWTFTIIYLFNRALLIFICSHIVKNWNAIVSCHPFSASTCQIFIHMALSTDELHNIARNFGSHFFLGIASGFFCLDMYLVH